MSKIADIIKEIQVNNYGITTRKIFINKTYIYFFFITQIVKREIINENILKPILNNSLIEDISVDLLVSQVLYVDDILVSTDTDALLDYILNGNTVVIIPSETKYIVINTKNIEKRPVASPEVESVIKGPKDCFSENFDTNISLIRYRIKDKSLRIDKLTLGTRTKTSVAMVYIEDIANDKYVKEISQKLSQVQIDGILSSGHVQKLLSGNPFDLFPKSGIAERSDSACGAILEGKICIIVEGSNLALTLPKTFIEFTDSGEDHYENMYAGILSKLVRIFSILVTMTISSMYVMLVGFHMDIIPVKYTLILAEGRARVPFPSFIEAFLSEILAETLREASVRLPKQIGPAIGIVGTIVIGQAAVSAGLISPLMVIIIALSTMCSFVAPDITIMNSIRILKFLLLLFTSCLGVLGFSSGLIIIIIALCDVESFGVSYVSPVLPFYMNDIKNFIFSDINLNTERPHYLENKDSKRKK